MNDNINNYNTLLKELFDFYNQIKKYIDLFFYEKNDRKALEIDFYNDFIISNNIKNFFVFYDKHSNKFLLSIPQGIAKYNEIKNINNREPINIKDKMENHFFSYFTDGEVSKVISYYNVDFTNYIKSEFLYQYIKKILNICSNRKINYSDEYIQCSEVVGFKIIEIIIEIETRMFAKKFNLFYVPKSIGNKTIFRKVNLLCAGYKETILNERIEDLLKKLSYPRLLELYKYEEREFEKKYNLKKNSLEDEILEKLAYKSPKQKREELINELKSIKEKYIKAMNNN